WSLHRRLQGPSHRRLPHCAAIQAANHHDAQAAFAALTVRRARCVSTVSRHQTSRSPRGAGISPRPTTGSHLSPIKSSPVTPFEGTAARRWAFLERRRALTQSLKATSHAVWLWEGLVLRPSLPQASLVRTNRRAG